MGVTSSISTRTSGLAAPNVQKHGNLRGQEKVADRKKEEINVDIYFQCNYVYLSSGYGDLGISLMAEVKDEAR